MTFNEVEATIADLTAQIDTLTTWRDLLTKWRKDLDRQLMAIRSPIRDDNTRRRAMAIAISMERIDRGRDFMIDSMKPHLPARLPLDDLMREAGYISRDAGFNPHDTVVWHGTLTETTQKIRELTERRDQAQNALNATPDRGAVLRMV